MKSRQLINGKRGSSEKDALPGLFLTGPVLDVPAADVPSGYRAAASCEKPAAR
jgi:hypothetical protein